MDASNAQGGPWASLTNFHLHFRYIDLYPLSSVMVHIAYDFMA